jgi:transposase
MRRTEALQGVRMAMFLNVLRRWESAELNQEEAAELLGVAERTFRRWTRRYEEDGEAGLLDRRLGKTSGKRVPSDRAEEVERLYRERYQGFTVKHFHEHLVKDHGFGWGYTWTKLHLQWKGVVGKAPRKGAHRRKRERRPVPGMMVHQDGSRHAWLEGEAPLDLIVTLDDATGAIYSAFLIEEEGTASTFRALNEVFSEHGLPMSLYTDRGAHYFRTTKAGEIDRGHLTQVGRALEQLGVEHIGAFSPQARGRSERAFQTLQDRLVKELRLAGIAGIEAANAFIREVYLPAHNARFAVDPAGEGSAFTPIPGSRRRPRRDLVCRGGAAGRPRQLRVLPDAETADPRKPDAAPFRQGAGQGPRLPRRLARPLPRTPLHRPLRPERSNQRCEKRRLNPLGGATACGDVDDASPRHIPTGTKPEEADI